jgi:hypothetical protein
VMLLGMVWFLVAAFAAGSSDGVPCGGHALALVQVVVAVVGLVVSGATAATMAGVGGQKTGPRWLRREALLLGGLFVLWLTLVWGGCAVSS